MLTGHLASLRRPAWWGVLGEGFFSERLNKRKQVSYLELPRSSASAERTIDPAPRSLEIWE